MCERPLEIPVHPFLLHFQDRRGQHTPSNKTNPEDVQLAAQHILEVRQQGIRALEGMDIKATSVKRMHELYQRWCEAQGRTPVSLWVYRQVEKANITPQEGRQRESATARGIVQIGEEEEKEEASTVVADGHVDFQETIPGLPTNTSKSATTAITTSVTNTSVTSNVALTSTTTRLNTTMITTGNVSSSTFTSNWSATSSTTTTLLPTVTCATHVSISTTSATTTATALETLKQNRSRRKKRRLREPDWTITSMTRAERKARRNKGEAYITSSGKVQSRKIYQDKPCGCQHKCIPALGTPQTRRQVFDKFWGLASFTQQNAYVARMVTLTPLVQRRTNASSAKTCSRVYSVQFKVCVALMFLPHSVL